MNQEIVGKIEGYDVIYIPEKDILFCKNTTMPYRTMREALIDGSVDKLSLKQGLEMTVDLGIVHLACLETTLENCKEINKNIKKIKQNGRRFSKKEN